MIIKQEIEDLGRLNNMKRVITGNIDIRNITSKLALKDNTLLLNNLRANAFNGNVNGDIAVNLLSTLIKVNMKGKNIDVDKAMRDACAMKDTLSGTADFKADISLSGTTMEEQMRSLKGDVNFTVEEREFVSIVGPSGCGKSTILAILAGLLTPSEGDVTIGGKPLTEAKGTTALMPQRDQLFEWRSIMRNVLLGPEIQKNKSPEIVTYAKTLLEKYGLSEFTSKRPSELSGGMRQRAALIRTLVTSPKLLLLDEPFSALDFQTRLQVCDDVSDILRQENKTAILVTHDINEAISMSDKVIVLTERPASVKKLYSIDLDKNLPPLKRREQKSFAVYFRRIWKDLEVHNE